MKKKIIFVVLCAVLLLLFTSLSYGQDPGDPMDGFQVDGDQADGFQEYEEYRFREDPWDHLQSPPVGEDENFDVVTIVIDLGFCYIFYTF